MGKEIPDRWLDYKPIGEPIKGTRFIAFKVPLRENVNNTVNDVTTRLNISDILKKIPNLGLVIDLTFTTRYYSPEVFKEAGILYVKLMIPGKIAPKKKHANLFARHVQNFLDDKSNSGKIIGVHCTHGVNRTGLLICHYMIKRLKMQPDDAIKGFEAARGHKIDRESYRDIIAHLLEKDLDDWDDQSHKSSWDNNRSEHSLKRRFEEGSESYQPCKYRREEDYSSSATTGRRENADSYRSGDRFYGTRQPVQKSRSRSPVSFRRQERPYARSRFGDNDLRNHSNSSSRYNPVQGNPFRRDPLPSNNFSSNFSVMDQVYGNNDSGSSRRSRWQRRENYS